MWECGLKLGEVVLHVLGPLVTPHVGVWIETIMGGFGSGLSCVTPHVGVWIETIIIYV